MTHITPAHPDMPRPGEWYRHYKGELVQVLTGQALLEADGEKGEPHVVYESAEPPHHIWVRPLSLWLSEPEPGVRRFTRWLPGQKETP